MNLSALMAARAAEGKPVRIGLIGAGRCGTLFLAQARHLPGLHVAAVADHQPERSPTALALAQWPPLKAVARSLPEALAGGGTWVTTDALAVLAEPGLDVMVEATGVPRAAVRHALAAIESGIHVIMASVDADALAGPLLAARARDKGVIYSLAYGDRPALVCELVDWARACGFEVAAAGHGTRWLPHHRASTPETVWRHLGIAAERARAAGMNARVYNAFVDGTRAALDLASVANATGLGVPSDGLSFTPCGTHDLARLLRPTADGGGLEAMGQVAAVSSLERDGRRVRGALGDGVYVTFRTLSEHVAQCLGDHGLPAGDGGNHGARWSFAHGGGMELGVSAASVALRREATGCPTAFAAEVVAVAKRDLAPGETLDGAGGGTVWGRLLPARAAVAAAALPIGLAEDVIVTRPVPAGRTLGWADVAWAETDELVAFRREMERTLLA